MLEITSGNEIDSESGRMMDGLGSNAGGVQPFPNGQRMKRPPISWPVWVFRNLVFTSVKFFVVFAFYSVHVHHQRLQAVSSIDDGHSSYSGLHRGLSEFRRSSRSPRVTTTQASLRSSSGRGSADETVNAILWSRLELSGDSHSKVVDPFPDSFDDVFYKARYNEDYQHYIKSGRELGLQCTRGQDLRKIFETEILPSFSRPVLEIGPFIDPFLRGDNIMYFDVAPWSGLVKKATELDFIVSPNPVEITYVDGNGDLSSIAASNGEAHDLIVSSHVINMQNDMVRHLQSVSDLLTSGGYYVLFVPDKRFRIHRLVEETTIAEVLDDYYNERQTLTLRSVVESAVLQAPTTDSYSSRRGQSSSTARHLKSSDDPKLLESIRNALDTYQQLALDASPINYDIPQYHFTPQTLALMLDTLFIMKLTDLRVHQLYETQSGANEFSIVLTKSPHTE